MEFLRGTYFGRSELYSFLIRFDFDSADRQGLNMVSGEFYQGDPEPKNHVVSFFSTAMVLSEDGNRLEAEILHYAQVPDNDPLPGAFVCLRTSDGILANVIVLNVFRQIQAEYKIVLEKRSDFFRTITCQVDRVSGLTELGSLIALHQQAADRLAAIDIQVLNNFTQESIPVENGTVWDIDDLHEVMNQRFSHSNPGQLDWRFYLLVANRFRDEGTTGIMFDRLPSDRHHRQGAALFWEARREASPIHFERDYVRSIIHELGHTLNLIHPFEPSKRFGMGKRSLSPMNYPHEYPNGILEYWENFRWEFDVDESLFIRHGRLDEVVMGGARFGHGGHERAASRIENPRSGQSLRLSIRARYLQAPGTAQEKAARKPGPILYEFGSPVQIEAKLINLSNEEHEIEDALDPVHGSTFYLIEKPNGQTVCYTPAYLRCSDGRPHVLDPDRPAIYENISLSYGADGFYFMEPGKYRAQAVYRSKEGLLFSNALDIWIKYPDPKLEDLIVPSFDSSVTSFFSVWGAPSSYSEVLDRLHPLMDYLESSRTAHPLIDEWHRCECYLLDKGVKQISETGELTSWHPPSDKSPVEKMKQFLGLTSSWKRRKNQKVPAIPNLLFGHLSGALAKRLVAENKELDAKKVLAMATEYLGELKLPEPEQIAFRNKHCPDLD